MPKEARADLWGAFKVEFRRLFGIVKLVKKLIVIYLPVCNH
jgi:predicted transcriptional regulator